MNTGYLDGLDLRPFVLNSESLGTTFSASVDIGPALFYSRTEGQNLDQTFVLVNLETQTLDLSKDISLTKSNCASVAM